MEKNFDKMDASTGVSDTNSMIKLRAVDNEQIPSEFLGKMKSWPARKRSQSQQDDKLVKKLKTTQQDNNQPIHINEKFLNNVNVSSTEKEHFGINMKSKTSSNKIATENKHLQALARNNEESKSLTKIRTRSDIEESIKEASSMTHGQIPSYSKQTNEKLMSFWHCSINECLACDVSPAKYFTRAKWNLHIKAVHGLNRPMYVEKYGNPDLTQFKHSCYLCGKEVLQLYTVIKRHLETLHDGMTIEFYTTEFKDLILQERAKQPVLFNQRYLLEGWSEGCIYSCTLCSSPFYSTSNLENHLSVVHKNVDLSTFTMPTPTLTRYHKCYICGKKLRHEHKIIYRHLHKWHQLEINKYTNQFQDYVRLELRVKGMNCILEEEEELSKRPSLATYLNNINLQKQRSDQERDKLIKDWADFCDYKCFCQEIFGSNLKLHLHVTRKHAYKNMAHYRLDHGEPSVLHRLHKCRLCRNNIKWEASRIRDHLKKQHKDKNFTLQTYAQTFRQEILSDIESLNLDTQQDEAQVPFRFGKERLGGNKVEYSQEEWKHLTSKKVHPNSWVACPTCAWEMRQASLYRHINNSHPNVIQKLKEDLRAGKSIDPKWNGIEVDINASDEMQEDEINAMDAKVNEDSVLKIDLANIKEEEKKNMDLSFVGINPETGEIMLTNSLPNTKQEIDCILTKTNNASKIVYFCNSDLPVTTANNTDINLTATNTEDVEEEYCSGEEDGSLTGRIVVVQPSDEEIIDKVESSAMVFKTCVNDNTVNITTTTNQIDDPLPPENIADKYYEEDTSEPVEDKDCVDYELEQTIHLSADCKAYVASKPKLLNQNLLEEEMKGCNDNIETLSVTKNNEADCDKTLEEEGITNDNVDKANMNIQTDGIIVMNNTVTNVDFSAERNDDDVRSKEIVEDPVSKARDLQITADTDINIGDRLNLNNSNDRSFQSIIMDSDGGRIQRIAVIHQKGDGSSRVDRSILLNHISSLINNMDTSESDNLKIIEIEVEADESVDKTSSLLGNDVISKATKRKAGCGSSNSYGFSIKTISLPSRVVNNRVSRGTQVSKWTKMGGELQKIANHKIVEGRRRTSVSKDTEIMCNTEEGNISEKIEFTGSNGVAQCSIGVQVIWECRTRGTIDLDSEKVARDRITAWITTNSSQIQNCKKCPGCFKEFIRKRNLLQHLESKHGVQLTGALGHAFQMHMEVENATVVCPDCSIVLSKKSFRRHQRQIHKKK